MEKSYNCAAGTSVKQDEIIDRHDLLFLGIYMLDFLELQVLNTMIKILGLQSMLSMRLYLSSVVCCLSCLDLVGSSITRTM